MTIIEAINKAKHGDKIYNRGFEPNHDCTIMVEQSNDGNERRFNGWSKYKILTELNEYFLFCDKWEIYRKTTPTVFEIKTNDFCCTNLSNPKVFNIEVYPENMSEVQKYFSQEKQTEIKLTLIFKEETGEQVIK